MTPSIKMYCKDCKEPCSIVPYEEEYYPGQFTTLYLSDCCHEGVVDVSGKWIPQPHLKALYTEERSYNINPMSELDLD